MDPAIAATLIGVLGTALIGALAGAFHLLRSDLKDFRAENRADLQALRAENRADHRETNKRIDRLEGKLDGLIWAMAQAGFPAPPQPPEPPPESQV